MIARLPSALLIALATASATVFAQDATPAAPAAPAPPAPEQTISKVPEAKVERLVTEDSQVRIEETRVRGVPTSIVVHSKRGMGTYAIQPRNPGLDLTNDYGAGQRLWTFGF